MGLDPSLTKQREVVVDRMVSGGTDGIGSCDCGHWQGVGCSIGFSGDHVDVVVMKMGVARWNVGRRDRVVGMRVILVVF